MYNNKMKVEVECPHCGATGLYVGFAEQDGAAVECMFCKGSGKLSVPNEEANSYTSFTGRKALVGVERVYIGGTGYVISAKDVWCPKYIRVFSSLRIKIWRRIRFSRYGCSYTEWLTGAKPTPVKGLK